MKHKVPFALLRSLFWTNALLFCMASVGYAASPNPPGKKPDKKKKQAVKKDAKKATQKATKKGKKKETLQERNARRHKEHQSYLKLMQGELKRYMTYFKTRPRPKVYYLRYQMVISRRVYISATDGVIQTQSDTRKKPARRIHVDLRVGDHRFDQTGRDGTDWKIFRNLLPASSYCPRELNPMILKKLFWQNTDRQYRLAFGQYWRKRFIRSTQPIVRDKAGDFSKEPSTMYQAPLDPAFTFDVKRWKKILQRISTVTAKANKVISSSITIQGQENILLGVANDGSIVRMREFGYNYSMQMRYLSRKSKEFVKASDSGYAGSESKLPTEAQLRHKLGALWKNLRGLVASEEGDPDEGPAIVGPYIAGAMFYDILMVRLEAGRFLRKRDQRVFAKKMGKQIIPTFLTLIDDPTLRHWKGTPLSAHYLYDDEWVPSRRLVMVENGILKNFYMSRKPYKNFKRSNGHGRNAFGYKGFSRPGTTIVHSNREYSLPALKQKLVDEIRRQGKRYGYILKRFQGYSQVRNSTYSVTPEQLYRLDIKTGKLTRLKGLSVRTSALQVIRSILATGNDYTVFNGSDNEDSGSISITTVSPSLLLQKLVFQRIQLPEKKDYDLPPPFKVSSYKDIAKKKKSATNTCPPVDVCKRCAACQNKTKK